MFTRAPMMKRLTESDMTMDQQLQKYLEMIDLVFDSEELLISSTDNPSIIDYYNQSFWGYHFVHSKEGSIHLAMNYDGVFNEDGYYEQSKIIDNLIEERSPERILELASGPGFNSIYLSRQHPSLSFEGVDLTQKHVDQARKKARNIGNLCFNQGDMQNLAYDSDSFDLVFVVEGFCNAQDTQRALSEVFRVMRKNGTFVVIDGFRKKKMAEVGTEWSKAAHLVEHSMSAPSFVFIDQFADHVNNAGFTIEKIIDHSKVIMPNLKQLERRAFKFFNHPKLARILLKILPSKLLMNAVAGILMPLTVDCEVHGYYQINIRK